MKKKHVLIALLLFSSIYYTKVSAQILFAAKVGVNVADMNGKITEVSYADDTKKLIGLHIGGFADIPVADNVSLQPGINLGVKGNKAENGDLKIKRSVTWVEIPVHVAYKLDLDFVKVNLYAGPYFGYALGGKLKDDNEKTKLSFGDEQVDHLKKNDYGINIGVGFKVNEYYLSLQYGQGFANLLPQGDKNNSVRNAVIGISLGYFINN